MKQMNFDTKVDEISRKPQSHITQEDARQIQATEVVFYPQTLLMMIGVDTSVASRAARLTSHRVLDPLPHKSARSLTATRRWDCRQWRPMLRPS